MNTLIKLHDKVFKPYLKEEQILAAIDKMAKEIAADYKDETPLFVGVLNGAFVPFDYNMTASSAITTIGPTFGHIFFAT